LRNSNQQLNLPKILLQLDYGHKPINPRDTTKNLSINNLHIITGQINRKGAGAFSLTGQPNAHGWARGWRA